MGIIIERLSLKRNNNDTRKSFDNLQIIPTRTSCKYLDDITKIHIHRYYPGIKTFTSNSINTANASI